MCHRLRAGEFQSKTWNFSEFPFEWNPIHWLKPFRNDDLMRSGRDKSWTLSNLHNDLFSESQCQNNYSVYLLTGWKTLHIAGGISTLSWISFLSSFPLTPLFTNFIFCLTLKKGKIVEQQKKKISSLEFFISHPFVWLQRMK